MIALTARPDDDAITTTATTSTSEAPSSAVQAEVPRVAPDEAPSGYTLDDVRIAADPPVGPGFVHRWRASEPDGSGAVPWLEVAIAGPGEATRRYGTDPTEADLDLVVSGTRGDPDAVRSAVRIGDRLARVILVSGPSYVIEWRDAAGAFRFVMGGGMSFDQILAVAQALPISVPTPPGEGPPSLPRSCPCGAQGGSVAGGMRAGAWRLPRRDQPAEWEEACRTWAELNDVTALRFGPPNPIDFGDVAPLLARIADTVPPGNDWLTAGYRDLATVWAATPDGEGPPKAREHDTAVLGNEMERHCPAWPRP